MKLLMILGGLVGFGIGLTFGWVGDNTWPGMLWRGCVAAYLAGLLLRWWGRVWIRNLEQALRDRQTPAARLESPAVLTRAKP